MCFCKRGVLSTGLAVVGCGVRCARPQQQVVVKGANASVPLSLGRSSRALAMRAAAARRSRRARRRRLPASPFALSAQSPAGPSADQEAEHMERTQHPTSERARRAHNAASAFVERGGGATQRQIAAAGRDKRCSTVVASESREILSGAERIWLECYTFAFKLREIVRLSQSI